MFLYNILVTAMPFVQAAYDSGWYGINQKQLRDDLLAFTIDNATKER